MKPRTPLTIEAALDRAAGLIGYDAFAAAVGKSESLARKMADPDCEQAISQAQALALDIACLAEAGEAPVSDTIARILEAHRKGGGAGCIVDALLQANSGLGRLNQAIHDGKCPRGPGGKDLTAVERKNINDLVQSVRSRLDQIERQCSDVTATVTPIRHEGKIA